MSRFCAGEAELAKHGINSGLIVWLVVGCLATGTALAQLQRSDPTAAPAVMADTMRAQIAEFRNLTCQALVVGADDDGVAILRASGQSSGATPAFVRAGTAIGLELGGMPVRVVVKSVSSRGVEIEAPTLAEGVAIPGSFKALAAPETMPENFLRYIECQGVALDTVLRLISDQTDANLAASSEAAKEPVSIFLRNVTSETAIEEICRTRNLWFRRDDLSGVTRVTTMKEYEENLSSFREETTEAFTLLYPNVLEVASVIYGLYPERVSISLGEEDILDDEERDISRRFNRLNAISSSSGSSFLGGGFGGTSGGGNYGGSYSGSSSSYGSGTTLLRGGRLQRQYGDYLDVRPRETFSNISQSDAKLIEAVRREGTSDDLESALDSYREKNTTIYVTASRRNNLLVVRTGDPKVMAEIRDLVRRLDVPTPMVLLEIKVLHLSISDDFRSSFEYEMNYTFNSGGDHPGAGSAGFPGFNPINVAARTDAMSFMILSDHLNLRIQMLEKEGRIKTLATPSLLTANNEVSRLFIGEERPMVRNISSETVVSDQNVVTTPQTETDLQAVGTMLVITPNINADRTVTLRLLQENSEILKNDASIPVVSSAGVVQEVAIDVVSTRSISGTFVAKDQMMVAVGGLIEERDVLQESRVPILGRIPLLGFFFKSKQRVKSRNELVLLIRPHVISTPAEGEAISKRLLEQLATHPASDGRATLGIYQEKEEEEEAVR
ncbi:MAG: type II secretion system protein GspD [Lentisphaerae bacterium]|nr:type II secretion system protein GspD [Lentisphaerota bacterium]